MKHVTADLTLALSLGLVSFSAQSQTVYRCGNAYSQAPCPDATLVDASDSRSASQQADARQVARQQRQQADDMARERRALEREQRPPLASGFDSRGTPSAVATPGREARSTRKKRSGAARATDPGADFRAIVPGSGKKPARSRA